MNLAQFLGNVGNAMGGFDPMATIQQVGQQPAMPTVPLLGDVTQQQAAPRPAPVEAPKKRGGVKDLLGRIGDALLVSQGGEPVYQQQKQREKLGEDLANYLGVDDPRLAALVRDYPETFAPMFNANREDKRFDRTAGQDDQRIGISRGQLGLGIRELDERVRSNQAGEGLTKRGQDVTSGTQVTLQRMRDRQDQLKLQWEQAKDRNDFEQAKQLLALGQQNALEIKALENGGGTGGYEETTVTTEGTPAKDGWFTDTPGTPTTKTTTRKPIQRQQSVTSEAAYNALPRGATFVGPDGKTYRKP